jgi:hypothetical protein
MNLLMRRLDLFFGVPIVAWGSNGLSSGEHSKGLDAQINPYFLLAGMEDAGRIQLILSGKDGKPLVAFPLNRTGLDLAPDLPMPLDLDVADLGETQAVPDDLIAILRIGEAVIALATLEAG